ncbi:MAG: HAD family hydrolase [Bacteroidales bacterium]|nr:HAD family hydrolase [Bacteroidales bacterium]
MKKLVIFDLDGTLLNTVGDIAAATNHALQEHHYPTRSEEEIRSFVGNGINKLFERALPEGHKTQEDILQIRSSFIPYYNAHGTEKTVPFPGIPELLEYLQEQGAQLAVASNKYEQATRSLVAHYFPQIRFTAVLGQREGIPVKPDPFIVHEICATAGADLSEVLYVGDSGVDMQTAIHAGVDVIGVTWGCRPRTELEKFQPNWVVDQAAEIQRIYSDLSTDSSSMTANKQA